MKQLIFIYSIITLTPFCHGNLQSLKDLTNQKILQQIQTLHAPTLSSEEKIILDNILSSSHSILDLTKLNYDFLNLSGINFYEANFQGVRFNGTNFSKADLRGCNFKGATLRYVNLQEANITLANFEECKFQSVKLQGAIIGEKVTLTGETEFIKLPYYLKTVEILKLYSDLQDKEDKLEDKKALNKLISTGAFDFQHQTIKGLNLRKINFNNCKFNVSDISDCDLTDAQFGNSSIKHTFSSNIKLAEDFKLEAGKSDSLIDLYNAPATSQSIKNIIAKILAGSSYDLANINLSGATLFGEFIIPKYKTHEDLVQYYCKSQDPVEKLNLNRLFDFLPLKLKNNNLIRGLNLTGMNLRKVDMCVSKLQGCILFEDFIYPEDRSNLFKRYSQSQDLKEKQNINKFFDIWPPFITPNNPIKGLNSTGMNFAKAQFHRSHDMNLSGTTLFEGFTIPEYTTHEDLVRYYSKSEDPVEKQNLNRFFNIFPLKLKKSDLRNLDLTGINLTKARIYPTTRFQGALLLEGFKIPDYNDASDLIKIYGKSNNPNERRNLNRFFDLLPLKLHVSSNTQIDLRELDLREINLINAQFDWVNFSGCNLIDSIYEDERFYYLFGSLPLKGVQLSEDFVFPAEGYPSDWEKDLINFYSQTAKTDRQKYYFKVTLDLQNWSSCVDHLTQYDLNSTRECSVF